MTQEQSLPNAIVLDSVLTCPHCGHAKCEDMPVDACQFFYECERCKRLLRPLPGDCCVFCSFGSVKCPPIQAQRSCCGGDPRLRVADRVSST
ncbi:GDCCVxC domain-containing (seleno)protein [Variovorax boronicumulans]|uniref:GDCCVxC domain-containing (seleno)protein n=1 Tax=Variovorax boronicumulans TaxID=436515 RepID=UPI0013300C44|nr:GDCCVxC domain-containing (seleno)protein [Variovorax boronicumulans]